MKFENVSASVSAMLQKNNIQLSPEGEVNSGTDLPRNEASGYISSAVHRP